MLSTAVPLVSVRALASFAVVDSKNGLLGPGFVFVSIDSDVGLHVPGATKQQEEVGKGARREQCPEARRDVARGAPAGG